jgi:hypothetical protein
MIGFIGISFTVTLNYSQLQQFTVNDCLRLAPFCWTSAVFSSTVTDFVPIYESLTSSRMNSECRMTTHLRMNVFLLPEGPNISHHLQHFLCHCVSIRCCGNVPSNPLPISGCPSSVESVTPGTRLRSHCLAMIICVTIFTREANEDISKWQPARKSFEKNSVYLRRLLNSG